MGEVEEGHRRSRRGRSVPEDRREAMKDATPETPKMVKTMEGKGAKKRKGQSKGKGVIE